MLSVPPKCLFWYNSSAVFICVGPFCWSFWCSLFSPTVRVKRTTAQTQQMMHIPVATSTQVDPSWKAFQSERLPILLTCWSSHIAKIGWLTGSFFLQKKTIKMKKTSSFEDTDTDQESTCSSSRAGVHHKYGTQFIFDSTNSNEPGRVNSWLQKQGAGAENRWWGSDAHLVRTCGPLAHCTHSPIYRWHDCARCPSSVSTQWPLTLIGHIGSGLGFVFTSLCFVGGSVNCRTIVVHPVSFV